MAGQQATLTAHPPRSPSSMEAPAAQAGHRLHPGLPPAAANWLAAPALPRRPWSSFARSPRLSVPLRARQRACGRRVRGELFTQEAAKAQRQLDHRSSQSCAFWADGRPIASRVADLQSGGAGDGSARPGPVHLQHFSMLTVPGHSTYSVLQVSRTHAPSALLHRDAACSGPRPAAGCLCVPSPPRPSEPRPIPLMS